MIMLIKPIERKINPRVVGDAPLNVTFCRIGITFFLNVDPHGISMRKPTPKPNTNIPIAKRNSHRFRPIPGLIRIFSFGLSI